MSSFPGAAEQGYAPGKTTHLTLFQPVSETIKIDGRTNRSNELVRPCIFCLVLLTIDCFASASVIVCATTYILPRDRLERKHLMTFYWCFGCLFLLQLAHKLRKEVDHDNSEEQAVDTIKDAAVPWHKLAAILDVRLAFDERFGQVAQRCGHTDQKAEQDRQVPAYTQGAHGKEQSCGDRE